MSEPVNFSSATSRFSLPLLFQGQAQKEFFHNEALSLVDALLFLSVEGESAVAPTVPTEGEAWIVAASATGEWQEEDGKIAIMVSGDWRYLLPETGMLVYDKTAGQLARFENSWIWAEIPNQPSGGTTIDAEARAAIDQILDVLRKISAIPLS